MGKLAVGEVGSWGSWQLGKLAFGEVALGTQPYTGYIELRLRFHVWILTPPPPSFRDSQLLKEDTHREGGPRKQIPIFFAIVTKMNIPKINI